MSARQILTENVKLRLDRETLDELERVSAAADRTVAAEIRRAIRLYLAEAQTKEEVA